MKIVSYIQGSKWGGDLSCIMLIVFKAIMHHGKINEDSTWQCGDKKNSLQVVNNTFQHEKINFVSPSDHVMFYLYYINTNEIPDHFTSIAFGCERCNLLCSHSNGNLFTCENNMLFSRVKICFRTKAHLLVFIFNSY